MDFGTKSARRQLYTEYKAFKTRRKRFEVFLLVLVVLMLPFMHQVHESIGTNAVLPKSLRIIQDDAFAGTKIRSVKLGDEIVFIGSLAFPTRTVIYGEEHSYAEYWAADNGYRFVSEDYLNVKSADESFFIERLLLLIWLIVPGDIEKKRIICKRMREVIKSMRPQDRPEMYPIDYRFP